MDYLFKDIPTPPLPLRQAVANIYASLNDMLSFYTASLTVGLTAIVFAGHGERMLKRALPAFDTYPQNSIPNNGGPVLYYNGTGNVPAYVLSTSDCLSSCLLRQFIAITTSRPSLVP